MARKWILVAGTGQDPLPNEQRWVTEALGRTLAERGYGLVTGGWHGVDAIVSQVFAAVVRAQGESLDDRLIQVVTRDHAKVVTPGKTVGRIVEVRPDLQEWVVALNLAHAVVLIGGVAILGKGGTIETYQHARKRRLPVFPIPGTSSHHYGAAREAYDDLLAKWGKPAPFKKLSRDDLTDLDVAVEDETDAGRPVMAVLDLLERELGPTEHSGPGKVRILFLTANPSSAPLEIDREIREIQSHVLAAPHRDRFELFQEHAVHVDDLQAALLRHRPQILHFSGHGRRAGVAGARPAGAPRDFTAEHAPIAPAVGSEILLEGDAGTGAPITAEALGDLIRIVGGVRGVVLNACHSHGQADALRKHVDCVIGMSRTIADHAAIAFAWAFYQGLGFGQPVDKAFELGKNQLLLQLEERSEAEVPRLVLREGLTADRIDLTAARDASRA
jgi:hypothetical protein